MRADLILVELAGSSGRIGRPENAKPVAVRNVTSKRVRVYIGAVVDLTEVAKRPIWMKC
jgi:hypothetical protein